MKNFTIIIFMFFGTFTFFAQETVGGRVLQGAKDKTYQRTEDKGAATVDKALDKVEDKIFSIFKKKDKKKKEETQETDNNQTNKNSKDAETTVKTKAPKTNSKFDFVAGEKLIAFDDFATTNIGDFPLGWNTNSSAEIRTIDKDNKKWLSMTKDGFFQPEYITNLPENFTLEFEVYTRYRSNNMLNYSFYLNAVANPKKDLSNKYIADGFNFNWAPCTGVGSYFVNEKSEEVSKNESLSIKDYILSDCDEPTTSKIAIWRQKTRLRIYVNEDKILDIPQAFDPKLKYNSFKFANSYMNYSNGIENEDEFMVANIRYAVAGTDNRSKLITEGRFVTNGILFDTNSDNIKPESGTVLKEIAAVLKENPSVKIKIIGHTDSDGEANANLILSQKRAAAIKTSLSSFYDIDGSRMETDGKGESQALNKNANPAEKAMNRRVEFIKL